MAGPSSYEQGTPISQWGPTSLSRQRVSLTERDLSSSHLSQKFSGRGTYVLLYPSLEVGSMVSTYVEPMGGESNQQSSQGSRAISHFLSLEYNQNERDTHFCTGTPYVGNLPPAVCCALSREFPLQLERGETRRRRVRSALLLPLRIVTPHECTTACLALLLLRFWRVLCGHGHDSCVLMFYTKNCFHCLDKESWVNP